MKFNTEGLRRKDFKTAEEYLGAVYDKNKITQISKKVFINRVKAYKELDESAHPTLRRAMNKLASTNVFTPYGERAIDNFVKGAKEIDPDFIKRLSSETRDKRGRFTKFDKSELKWNKDAKAYVYMGMIKIDISDSPKTIDLIRL